MIAHRTYAAAVLSSGIAVLSSGIAVLSSGIAVLLLGCGHTTAVETTRLAPEVPQHECALADGQLVLHFDVPEGHALATSPEACLLADEVEDSYALIVTTLGTDQVGAELLAEDPNRFFQETGLLGEATLVDTEPTEWLGLPAERTTWNANPPDVGPTTAVTLAVRRGSRWIIGILFTERDELGSAPLAAVRLQPL